MKTLNTSCQINRDYPVYGSLRITSKDRDGMRVLNHGITAIRVWGPSWEDREFSVFDSHLDRIDLDDLPMPVLESCRLLAERI